MVMTGKKRILFCLMSLLVSVELLAGSITGELDKTQGNVDDTFVYTLTIEGQFSSEPQFPNISEPKLIMQV